MSKYSFIAKFEPGENNNFGVYFPELPGCISAGQSLSEARENAKEALLLHLEGLFLDDDTIPENQTLEDLFYGKGELTSLITVEAEF